MVRKLASYVRLTILLTGVWIVFSERVDAGTIAFGVAGSILALLATNRLVLKGSYAERYRIRTHRILAYAIRLLVAIYVAGFQAIWRMVTGRVHVGIVDITTTLEDPFAISLLANSITLTPGTVTLAQEGERLKVIWLDCRTHDPEIAGAEIKGPFERLLQGVVR
ncbi:MAG: Na+/H+ antiporter subunit E [Spirochaetota bacterium]